MARELPEQELLKAIKNISDRIKEKRIEQGPLEDFAYEINVSRSTLHRCESGYDLRMSTFIRILYGLDIQPEDFFKGIK